MPEHLKKVFVRGSEFKAIIHQLNLILREAKAKIADNDPLYTHIKYQQLEQEMAGVKRNFKFAIPYAVCGICGGDFNNENCRTCNGSGFLNEMQYQTVPPEFK